MRKLRTSKRSYFWLKVLVILAVIATAYLLITKQYLILIEAVGCSIVGKIIYCVIVHKLEHRSIKQAYIAQDNEQRQKTAQDTQKQNSSEINLKKIDTKDLIEELSSRGQIK